jgi:fructokinase
MKRAALIVGLGEVLWDLLPSGKVLGGAPANFAYMAHLLGDRGVVASRVGDDALGQEACAVMASLGLSTQYIQQDCQHETGFAEVAIDDVGQPMFTIKESVSWDFLEWTQAWEGLARKADVICFGSLAQRSAISATTVGRFLRASRPEALRIFDVNLRQKYYSNDILERSLQYADVLKLTDHELIHLTSSLGFKASGEEESARQLLQECDLKLVCVTRGSRGSLLVSYEETVEHPGIAVKVVDSVGAGDAFTACLAHHLVRGRSLEEISEFANRLASWVATQVGATPSVDRMGVQSIIGGTAREA